MLGGQPSTLEVAGLTSTRALAAWTAPNVPLGFKRVLRNHPPISMMAPTREIIG